MEIEPENRTLSSRCAVALRRPAGGRLLPPQPGMWLATPAASPGSFPLAPVVLLTPCSLAVPQFSCMVAAGRQCRCDVRLGHAAVGGNFYLAHQRPLPVQLPPEQRLWSGGSAAGMRVAESTMWIRLFHEVLRPCMVAAGLCRGGGGGPGAHGAADRRLFATAGARLAAEGGCSSLSMRPPPPLHFAGEKAPGAKTGCPLSGFCHWENDPRFQPLVGS